MASTTTVVTVKGAIGNVRWLESEYGATKTQEPERHYNSWKTFTAYQVELANNDPRLDTLLQRLNGDDGVWYDAQPGFDVEYILDQIAILGRRAADSLKPELRAIYREVRDGGEAAYLRHRTRLQYLNSR